MPLDAIFLHHLKEELQFCVGCRADKIHQPTRDELVLLLRSANFTGRLLISTRSGSARVHITEENPDNPAEPPAFCKLLRRHLSSAKIVAIEQHDLDRVLTIRFMTYNEMGDTIYPFLVIELITGRSNVILCDETGRIHDALHRSDIENSARLIQPGARYTYPDAANKLNPFTATPEEIKNTLIATEKPLGSAFMAALDGVSPLVSRELAFKTKLDPDTPVWLVDDATLIKIITEFKETITAPSPTVLKDGDELKDFCYTPVSQYGSSVENIGSEGFSRLIDQFYADRDRAARIKGMAQDILKLLNNIRNRISRKQSFRLADLEKCKNREQYRIYGELIKANIYAIEKGATVARVQNYYDENMGFIDIPLDPALSASANAAKYFKEYKKTYTAEQTLTVLIDKDEKELVYIDSVLDALSRASSASELGEIREELYDSGYLIRTTKPKKKSDLTRPKEFLSPGGFKILVGRNNRENDLLTTKTASKQDLWFHTKNIPGSHVILFTEGKEVDEDSLVYAARLAATNSKASKGENVPVDFTEVKNVKKPSGAKPGMVIYTTNKTIYAKPL